MFGAKQSDQDEVEGLTRPVWTNNIPGSFLTRPQDTPGIMDLTKSLNITEMCWIGKQLEVHSCLFCRSVFRLTFLINEQEKSEKVLIIFFQNLLQTLISPERWSLFFCAHKLFSCGHMFVNLRDLKNIWTMNKIKLWGGSVIYLWNTTECFHAFKRCKNTWITL